MLNQPGQQRASGFQGDTRPLLQEVFERSRQSVHRLARSTSPLLLLSPLGDAPGTIWQRRRGQQHSAPDPTSDKQRSVKKRENEEGKFRQEEKKQEKFKQEEVEQEQCKKGRIRAVQKRKKIQKQKEKTSKRKGENTFPRKDVQK